MLDKEYVERLHRRVQELEEELQIAKEENLWLRERARSIHILSDIGHSPPPAVNKKKIIDDKHPLRPARRRRKRDLADGELSTRSAAEYIGKSKAFLDSDRQRPEPKIPFERRGPKTIVYHKEDLDAYNARVKKAGSYVERQV